MRKSLPKYEKPTIKSKKIKMSYFLSNISFLDNFTLAGDVFAQSSQCDDACIGAGGCNCSCGCAGGCGCDGNASCLGCGTAETCATCGTCGTET